ncbi:hypothetical protein OSB04_021057 [Centaurea solstitialis]|uniref:Uncharacterized protein n=1 Tax=Centaurea solstitialis TaxID=347529 RepID=A0AA38SV38_9ASTR|nr:hypothetical protein OSB04_021057 [Centaurea solstitialis]
MALLAAFTSAEKTSHNSHKFAFTLSPTNYGYWKAMIHPFLLTNNLFGYVDGTIPCSAKLLQPTDPKTDPKENPNYPVWVSNDAHVRMVIISTISEASFRHVQGTTSRDLWLSLERAYAPHSSSGEYTLKTQLLKMEMKDKDLVMLAVSDLREEYNSFKSTITARQFPTAFNELHVLLSDQDYMLKKTHNSQNTPIQAFHVTNNDADKIITGSLASVAAQLSALGLKLVSAADTGAQSLSSQSFLQFSSCPSRDPSTIRTRPAANYVNNNASPSNASNAWFPDTGANSHVTPDLASMDDSRSYYGNDTLHVGDGKGLPILHIGSSHVHSPHKTFSLSNILHVPEIKKNLLSVQKFCLDNNVFFEFHSSFFVVKDESTRTTLLTGPSEHGLYSLRLPQLHSIPPVAFSAARASSTTWHKRLGHPNQRLFNFMLSSLSLPVTNKTLSTFCSSCQLGKSSKIHLPRRHRHVVETGLALMAQAHIPQRFWHFAFETAVYLINRMPSRISNKRSPYQHLFNRVPDYTFLRVFGCLCFPHLRPYNPHKMDFRSTPCVFLGYSPLHHGYRCLDLPSDRIYIARHVRFDEASFPFAITPSPPHTLSSSSPYTSSAPPTELADHSPSDTPTTSSASPHVVTVILSPNNLSTSPPVVTNTTPSPPYAVPNTPPPPPPPRARSSHLRQNPKRRIVFSLPLITPPYLPLNPRPSPSPTNLQSGVKLWPMSILLSFEMPLQGTFVAKGSRQQPGIDFKETFSPVVKSTTIRVVLSLVITQQWSLRQLDVQNAFLHGTLNEIVYMEQPPGFVDPQRPDHVCLLHKSIYGLKQAPRAWFQRLSMALFSIGFKGSKTDPSLFIYSSQGTILYMLVYVDDIIITGNNDVAINAVVNRLRTTFAIKDLGPLHYFLGIEIVPTGKDVILSQKKYIMELLQRAGLSGSKPTPSPMTTANPLYANDSPAFSDPIKFRQIIVDHGMLIRKTSSTQLQAFTDSHWQGSKVFSSSLTAFSDADWAGYPDDRRSTGGFAIYLGSNLISWTARKQRTMSRSSTESEYKALADTIAELTWLQALLGELDYSSKATYSIVEERYFPEEFAYYRSNYASIGSLAKSKFCNASGNPIGKVIWANISDSDIIDRQGETDKPSRCGTTECL